MSDLRLEYAGLHVGTVRGALQADGTWFGTVELAIDGTTSALHARLLDFIAFCEEWNERVREGHGVADPSEFDRFSDIVESRLWRTRASDGCVSVVVNAPVFFKRNEVSWQTE